MHCNASARPFSNNTTQLSLSILLLIPVQPYWTQNPKYRTPIALKIPNTVNRIYPIELDKQDCEKQWRPDQAYTVYN